MAAWLDKTFLDFEQSVFAWMHALQQKAGGFFNGFCAFISVFGKSGWFFILLGFIFVLFRARRKEGLGMAFALLMGAIVTNILLKNIVGRTRPFNREIDILPFHDWWVAAGSSFEKSTSFPSGHTTAAFAGMVSFFILGDKRYSWTGLVFAVLMGFSRMYLIVHYPTDVLVGFIVGTAAGVGGAFLSKLVYKKARGKFGTLLNEWSIVTQCKKWFVKKKIQEAPGESEQTTVPENQAQPESTENPEQTTQQ